MMNIITFTGIDIHTDLNEVINISNNNKNIEFGILFTTTPNERNRYMNLDNIKHTIEYLTLNNVKIALHVCGNGAKRAIMNNELDFISKLNRMQINGQQKVKDIELICNSYPYLEIITQHNINNESLLAVKANNHSILIDSSGGNGISPTEWILPDTSKRIGFAGGLGLDNIQSEISKFYNLKEEFWIDMENKIRTNDWFDLDIIKNILKLI